MQDGRRRPLQLPASAIASTATATAAVAIAGICLLLLPPQVLPPRPQTRSVHHATVLKGPGCLLACNLGVKAAWDEHDLHITGDLGR